MYNIEPKKPIKPILPEKIRMVKRWIDLPESGEMTMEELVGKIPNGILMGDVKITILDSNISECMYDSRYTHIRIFYPEEEENKEYERDMKRYRILIKRYKKEEREYEEKIRRYKEWKDKMIELEGKLASLSIEGY